MDIIHLCLIHLNQFQNPPNQDYLGGFISMLKIARNKTLSRCAVNDGLVTFNLF